MLKKFRQDYPRFKSLFQFEEFNAVQKQCYPKIINYQDNMIISAPTSSGKTVLFELMIAKMMEQHKTKCLYLAPIKSLCHEKYQSWRKKFLTNMSVIELTGDTLQMEPGEFGNADIYVATPQKIDYISRKNLNFLKELNLLLIDQIHMLNMEDRGAILEAIVSRIMSINKIIRIMAVSATIPNINEVAQWLKVPRHLICVFGEEYRPAKLHKVVLGFKPANNDFNFEKMLNFKILDVIRQFSFGRGSLIFCQTQKGTQEACSKLISQAKSKQFVENQKLANDLINASKVVDNLTLKTFLPHGVAFHNASLSIKDRSIVEGLFLDLKVKVLSTTSTLAMGINLPARLVIIKSTKCYKGSGKGYQEYSQIEMDQMMGRAGRIPFDKEGTVVIMTQKNNYNKYVGQIRLQNLESQLYSQFIDHLNTEISLKSIQTLKEAVEYFKNSFCYIRMQNSPKLYNLGNKNDVEKFVWDACANSLKKLAQYQIIQFIENNQKIYPKQCSNNISKNAIEVETIIKVMQKIGQIRTQRQYLALLCEASQLAKYRSKLDERKCLKDLNQKNRYTLKQAISTSQKKCFVLIQAQLTGIHIESWECRKQANEMIYFFKRLAFCVKSLALERKNAFKTFWTYLFGCLFYKYFSQGFWEQNEEKVLKQIRKVASKWKNITARGIRTLSDLTYGLNQLDMFGNGMGSVTIKRAIEDEINLLSRSLQINIKLIDNNNCLEIDKPAVNLLRQTNHLATFIFKQNFDERLKSIHIVVEHGSSIYHSGWLNQKNLEFSVFLKNTQTQKYFIAVIKQGYTGFDQYYWVQNGTLKKTDLRKQQNQKKLTKTQSLIVLNRPNSSEKYNNDETQDTAEKKPKKSRSLESSLKRTTKNKINSQIPKNSMPKEIKFAKNKQNMLLTNIEEQFQSPKILRDREQQFTQPFKGKFFQDSPSSELSSTMKANKKSKQLKLTQNFSTIKRRYIFDEETQQKLRKENPLGKSLKKTNKYRDLKSYNWKPGFQEIKDCDSSQALSFYHDQNFFLNQQNSNTISNQKDRKLMISNENSQCQSEQSEGLNITDTKYSNNPKKIIDQLKDYMVEKNNRIGFKKQSVSKKLNPFEKIYYTDSNITNYENRKKKPSLIKYIATQQDEPKQFNKKLQLQSEDTRTSSRAFRQKLQKVSETSFNQTINQPKALNSRKVPFLNRQIKHLKLEKKSPKLFSAISPILQQKSLLQQEKPNKQGQNKKFKNAYEYFESFLQNDEDDS